MPAALSCPTCGKPSLHHSRPRSWVERVRRLVTGRVPFRCHACNWRGWRDNVAPVPDGPREIHRALTDSQIAALEPDSAERRRATKDTRA